MKTLRILTVLLALVMLLTMCACGSDDSGTPDAETKADKTENSTESTAKTEAPETEGSETKEPETVVPETEVSETEVPETEAPETEAPETEAPETTAPETEAPETEEPETEEIETKEDSEDKNMESFKLTNMSQYEKYFSSPNQTELVWNEDGSVTFKGTWDESTVPVDPFVTFNFANMMRQEIDSKLQNVPNKNGEYSALVLKVKIDESVAGNFFMHYAVGRGNFIGGNGDYFDYEYPTVDAEGTGDYEYIIFDLSYTIFTEDIISQLRFDWVEDVKASEDNVGASMTLYEISLYKDFDAALKGCSSDSETEPDVGPQRPDESLEIPSTRYDGREIVFLTRDEGDWSSQSIFAENAQNNDSPLSEAVYTRNQKILQDYGVTIKEYKVPAHEIFSKVSLEVSAYNYDFQAVEANVTTSVGMAQQTLLENLYHSYNLYLNKSWWDYDMTEDMVIDDHIFFATGDLFTLDDDATMALMFNKEIAQEEGLPDLYNLVSQNEWTFDKLFAYEQNATKKNGNGALAYNRDICGMAYTYDSFYTMFYAGGVSFVGRNEDDFPEYGLDVGRADKIVAATKNILSADYAVSFNDAGISYEEFGKTCFGEGHALFWSDVLHGVRKLRGYDVDFGILPHPMYDKNQGNYTSFMHSVGSVLSIPGSIRDEDMVYAIIEAMAYHSVNTVTKQYYKLNLTTKDGIDTQSAPMLDLILNNRVYDLAYYYGWGDTWSTAFEILQPTSDITFSNRSPAMERKVNKEIENAIENLMNHYS